MKVMKGRQILDSVNKNFILPKLLGKKETGALWKNYDWNKAAAAGMKYKGVPYSGKYEFVETRMYWPLTYMVSSKKESLSCVDCHSRNGRLESLDTNWLPGKDRVLILDILGFESAVLVHDCAAYTLLALVAFAAFWHIMQNPWQYNHEYVLKLFLKTLTILP